MIATFLKSFRIKIMSPEPLYLYLYYFNTFLNLRQIFFTKKDGFYSLSLNAKIDFPLWVVCFRIIYLVATIRKGD